MTPHSDEVDKEPPYFGQDKTKFPQELHHVFDEVAHSRPVSCCIWKLGSYVIGSIDPIADPYSSRQKGAIENVNGLIRQYIPKGTDISTVADKRIASIQAKINRRPREKLNFLTPNEVFFKHFA